MHVLDRLTGYEGESAPPNGTGERGVSRAGVAAQAIRLAVPASPRLLRPRRLEGLAGGAGRHRHRQDRRSPAPKRKTVFMTSPSPGQIARYLKNNYYKSDEAYVYAVADAMGNEYKAIVNAGFILQLDAPSSRCPLNGLSRNCRRRFPQGGRPRRAINHACAIPSDRMRMHLCWGSTRPRTTPTSSEESSISSIPPRSMGFRSRPPIPPRARMDHLPRRQLPAGKIIYPGVIDSTTTWSSIRSSSPSGWRTRRRRRQENVIAGVDCGFATFAARVQVDTKIVWMKLASLAEGARRASKQLWAKAA